MTLLIASVHGEVPDGLSGADLLEIRIDGLSQEECNDKLPKLLSDSPIPTIVTCRSVAEGGMFDGSEEERTELYLSLIHISEPTRPY